MRSVYFVAILLLYITALACGYLVTNTIINAIIFGTISWVGMVIPIFLFLWCAAALFKKWLNNSIVYLKILIVGLAIIVCGVLLGHAIINTRPRARFEMLIMTPMPESINSLECGGFNSMQEMYWLFKFMASNDDARSIIDKLHMFEVKKDIVQFSDGNKAKYVRSGIKVNIDESWKLYRYVDNECMKRIYINTSGGSNFTDIVFVISADGYSYEDYKRDEDL